jgi:hypothetical protein
LPAERVAFLNSVIAIIVFNGMQHSCGCPRSRVPALDHVRLLSMTAVDAISNHTFIQRKTALSPPGASNISQRFKSRLRVIAAETLRKRQHLLEHVLLYRELQPFVLVNQHSVQPPAERPRAFKVLSE